MKQHVVFNETRGEVLLPKGQWCASLWCKFKGLMLRRNLPADEGLIFAYKRPSKMDTTIHMFFVFFPISVIWVSRDMEVITVKLAKPWRPYYAPKKAAQYFIEGDPGLLNKVQVGDKLRFDGGR